LYSIFAAAFAALSIASAVPAAATDGAAHITRASASQTSVALPGQRLEYLARNDSVLPSQRPEYLARNEDVLPSQRPAYLA